MEQQYCTDDVFTKLYYNHFHNQLKALCMHSISNFCVQAWLRCVRDKSQAIDAFNELKLCFADLFSKAGV